MDKAYFRIPRKCGKRGMGATKTLVLAALSLDAFDRPLYDRLTAADGEALLEFAAWSIALDN
ncbi:MAG: hypothetical protein LBU32_09310 [Clostridiales bacterium]|jgi:hypothetical protein|nr:hypothetical protein [Clostridiales bacterium]